jgi:hypothetical protein
MDLRNGKFDLAKNLGVIFETANDHADRFSNQLKGCKEAVLSSGDLKTP